MTPHSKNMIEDISFDYNLRQKNQLSMSGVRYETEVRHNVPKSSLQMVGGDNVPQFTHSQYC